MKSIMIALFVLIGVFMFNSNAFAEQNWTGAQVQCVVKVTDKLTEDIGWSGTLCRFEVPSAGRQMYFAYTGVHFNPTKWLMLSPQFGGSADWIEGEDSFVAAGWIDIKPVKGIVIGLDGEYFNTGGKEESYWFNQVNYNRGNLNVGVHWESRDNYGQFGPHIGYTKKQCTVELQYYTGEDDHAVRVFTKLKF